MRINWEEYALRLAKVAALRSEDPYTKVGACVLRCDNTVAGIGYNGAPPGVNINWENREEKNLRVIHSETNALKYCTPGTVYLLACTHSPCARCLSTIAGYGIKKIVFEQWYHRERNVEILSKEFGIELKQLTILEL